MAIAHDAQTRFPTTDTTGLDTTTGDRTFTHTPVGTPAGVVVVICCEGTSAPVTGVLYDGVSMTQKTAANDTAEAGSVWIYTLTDVVIGSGAKTVTLQGCTAVNKFATCSTVTSDSGQSQVVGSQGKNTTTAANPTLNVVTTLTALLYGGLNGGASAPTSYAPGTGYTTQYSVDYGSLSGRTQRSTSTIASGTIVFNYDYITSDDYCLAVVALAEKTTVKLGAVSASFTFNKSVSGSERFYGQVAAPFTFVKAVLGQKKTYGQVLAPFTFVKAVVGRRHAYGQLLAPFIFNKSVAGSIRLPISTSVAEISLTSHGVPSARTDHSIRFRARTTVGSTGVLKVALYEGSANRSGTLTSEALSNTLAEYTLFISDINAAAITDYSNLSIRFWGYDSAGLALSFEVSEAYLRTLPHTVVTLYGVTSLPIIFSKAIAGYRKTFGQLLTPFTFIKSVSGGRRFFGQLVTPFTFSKSVSGFKKTFSQLVALFTFTKSVIGQRKTFSQSSIPITFDSYVDAHKLVFSGFTLDTLIGIEVSGIESIIILNQAKNVCLGSNTVVAVYSNSQKIWPTE